MYYFVLFSRINSATFNGIINSRNRAHSNYSVYEFLRFKMQLRVLWPTVVAIKFAQTRRSCFSSLCAWALHGLWTWKVFLRNFFFFFYPRPRGDFFSFFLFLRSDQNKTKTPPSFFLFLFYLKTERHLVCRVWRETLRTISNNVFFFVGEGDENMEFLSKDNFNAFKCPYLVFSRKTCCCRAW